LLESLPGQVNIICCQDGACSESHLGFTALAFRFRGDLLTGHETISDHLVDKGAERGTIQRKTVLRHHEILEPKEPLVPHRRIRPDADGFNRIGPLRDELISADLATVNQEVWTILDLVEPCRHGSIGAIAWAEQGRQGLDMFGVGRIKHGVYLPWLTMTRRRVPS